MTAPSTRPARGDFDAILGQLRGVRKAGDRAWLACCPAHEDARPSLSISVASSGAVLLHCFAGCDVRAIVRALGLSMRDLFPPETFTPATYRPRRGRRWRK